MSAPRRSATSAVPSDCWYAAVPSSSVARELQAIRVLDRPLVLFRTEPGTAVALEDRCVHRAFPLSSGTLVGDDVRCGLCGFVYNSDGRCIGVPTQPNVPSGARVASFPLIESDGIVWVWLGEPGRARLHRVPRLPWLVEDGWATVGDETEVSAGFLLLHESFADVTQVPFVAPEIAPAVLAATSPPLDIIVTETTVSLHREYPVAPLPAWQSALLGGTTDEFTTTQDGHFLSPAAWVDHWDVTAHGGHTARLRFTQLVTPTVPGFSRVLWRVSRDFATTDTAANTNMTSLFRDYYSRVFRAMETAQRVLDTDGARPEVNVSADAAALKVREIVHAMLAGEIPHRP